PEDAAHGARELARFERALAELSEAKRVVFLLVEREGMSGEDVARALDVPVNTVWSRLHHARGELRSALAEQQQGGATCSARWRRSWKRPATGVSASARPHRSSAT